MHESADQIIKKLEITDYLRFLSGSLILEGDLSDTDAAAIDPDTSITYITQAGAAETRTLANATREGTVKYMLNTVYAADTVVTPANLANGTTITFNAAGDGWLGIFHAGEWHTLALYGTTAIA